MTKAEGGPKTRGQLIGLALGPALALATLASPPPGSLTFEAWALTALLVLMVVWWVSEAIPIPITSLLPLLFLPLFGVADMRGAAAPYFSPIVVLLLGGFILAKSVERWGLHERLALLTVSRAGSSPGGLSAGFLAAASVLSAWISNTATSIMLMPVALSVAYALGQKRGEGTPLTVALILSVAYGASIGGLATPIGTPTNLIVLGGLEAVTGRQIGFPQWMAIGVPTVLLLLPAAWLVLNRLSGPLGRPEGDPQAVVRERLLALGGWTTPEIRTLMLFAVVAFFWVFRRVLFQDLTLLGIRPFAGLTDAGIAVAGAIAVFLVPSGSKKERGSMLLDWEAAARIPWGVLLLFGGGLSLAAAITATGLGAALGGALAALDALPLVLIILTLTAGVIFATELTSNVATAAALTPVVLALAAGIGTEPVALAIPVALAASCAFMFPMATAPNALAYGTGELSIARMARIGVKLNLLGIGVIVLVARLLAPTL